MNCKIKVCGLNDPENTQATIDLKPNYVGHIFYPESKRYLDPANLRNFENLGYGSSERVAVLVDAELSDIEKLTAFFKTFQLHGDESPEFCKEVKKKHPQLCVIKAFGISVDFDFGLLEKYQDSVDYFLFDTKTAGHGGSGKSFDWKLLDLYKLDLPFFLSGGLTPENITQIPSHPKLYALDLNSGFESEPGIKNISLLKQVL